MNIPIIIPGHILRWPPVTDDGAIVLERSRNRHPQAPPCVIRRAVKRWPRLGGAPRGAPASGLARGPRSQVGLGLASRPPRTQDSTDAAGSIQPRDWPGSLFWIARYRCHRTGLTSGPPRGHCLATGATIVCGCLGQHPSAPASPLGPIFLEVATPAPRANRGGALHRRGYPVNISIIIPKAFFRLPPCHRRWCYPPNARDRSRDDASHLA